MTVETTVENKFAFSFKKNNIDEMFYNLTENPLGCEKKDFRLMLSTIYQLVEDEFGITFQNSSIPIKNTQFYLIKEGNDLQFGHVSFRAGSEAGSLVQRQTG